MLKTRDRIIHCALALFNSEGEQNVSTNHIAAKLGISPGNLYYHFRNKTEIIHSIFDLYAEDLAQAFHPENISENEHQRLLDYLDAAFGLMWRFRFFYANLPHFLRFDSVLQAKYLQVQQRLQYDLMMILRDFRVVGWLDIPEEGLIQLSAQLKFTTSCWLFYESVQSPTIKVTQQSVYQGVLHILGIVEPLTTPSGKHVVANLGRYYRYKIENVPVSEEEPEPL